MNTDKPCKWVNNENVPAAHQLEVLNGAIAMIETVKDLLQSIHAGGNEFSSGVIFDLDAILDKRGKFNFYSSLRNWRLGLEAQADNEYKAEEIEESEPEPEELPPCPLCGSDRVMPGLSTKAHTMAFCGNCGHTWEVEG